MTQKLFSLSAIILLLSTSLFSQTALEEYDPVENGAIQVPFSVSETKKVYFSISNLQYQPSTGTWRFSSNQFDVIGQDNKNTSKEYDGWIDLFSWATSGYDGHYPYHTACDMYGKGIYLPNKRFIPIPTRGKTNYALGFNNVLEIAGTNYDWGFYNKIQNGGDKAGMWRVLSEVEWWHLLYYRPNADSLYSIGSIIKSDSSRVCGLILLPDGWNEPTLRFISQAKNYTTNSYSIDEWHDMQQHGAVFLPAAGYRYNTNVVADTNSEKIHPFGCYWTGTRVYYVFFHLDPVRVTDRTSCFGHSVRLVQDVK